MFIGIPILIVAMQLGAEEASITSPQAGEVLPLVTIAYPRCDSDDDTFILLVLGAHRDGSWHEVSPDFAWFKNERALFASDSATIVFLERLTRSPLYHAQNPEQAFVPVSVGVTNIYFGFQLCLKGDFPGSRLPGRNDEGTFPEYLMTTSKEPCPLRELTAADVPGLEAYVRTVTHEEALAFDPGYSSYTKFSETIEGLSAYEILSQYVIHYASDPEVSAFLGSDRFAEMLAPLGLTLEEVEAHLVEQLLTPGQPLEESERGRVDDILHVIAQAVDIVEGGRQELPHLFLPSVLHAPEFCQVVPFNTAEGKEIFWVSATREYPPELKPSHDLLDKGKWKAYYYGIVQPQADGSIQPLWEERGIYPSGRDGPRIDLIGICDADGDGNPEVVYHEGGFEWRAYRLLAMQEGEYTIVATAGGGI